MERVEAWTVTQAADLLGAVSLSPPRPRGTRVTLDIPLDETTPAVHDVNSHARSTPPRAAGSSTPAVHTVYKRQEPVRRDSLKRRDALLKGKEGSRQRRRWENDRLVGNPHAEPPLPSDWQAAPTHPVRAVPYFLAPLWDAEYARVTQERAVQAQRRKAPARREEVAAEKVALELRTKLKRARGARGLLQDLEEEVRGFLEKWEAKEKQLRADGLVEPDSSDDEEIVFVGRGGVTLDERREQKQREVLEKDKLVFQSLVNDHGAAFGRYLVHCIAEYYGLSTWSRTEGDRREAYVGLKMGPSPRSIELPRPLWAVV